MIRTKVVAFVFSLFSLLCNGSILHRLYRVNSSDKIFYGFDRKSQGHLIKKCTKNALTASSTLMSSSALSALRCLVQCKVMALVPRHLEQLKDQ